jgi:hypothetical protein
MMEYRERKFCPYAFNQTGALHNMRCLEEKCMAWSGAYGGDYGYCKLIEVWE